jgi:hypothetical protein
MRNDTRYVKDEERSRTENQTDDTEEGVFCEALFPGAA